jgi:monovalent cation:H+ antiporter, CPA1 family
MGTLVGATHHSQGDAMHGLQTTIETLLVLLLIIFAVAVVVRWVRLPYPIALLVAGLLGFQPGFREIHLTPDLILVVFLPVLLFEGAYNVSARSLWRNIVPVSLLAVPGVVLGTTVTGTLVHWLLGLAWPVALLFGALISSTDPIAVVSLFRELGAPKRLALLVEGESLFNDGASITLFQIILAVVVASQVDIGGGIVRFFVNVLGALVIGLAVGWGGSRLLQTIDNAQLQITATVIAAYGSYLIAEHIGVSGAIAVVVTGLFFGNYGAASGISPTSLNAISGAWEFLGFLGNSFIFLFIGIELSPQLLLRNAGMILIAFVAAVVGRAVAVYVIMPFLRARYDIQPKFRPVLVWGGLRGAVSLALVLSIPLVIANGQPFPGRDTLEIIAFGVVAFSLVLQGLTMRPLLHRLGLAKPTDSESEATVVEARLHAVDAALTSLDHERASGALGELPYTRLRGAYRTERDQLTQQLAEMETAQQ